jgi:hypothetical protein
VIIAVIPVGMMQVAVDQVVDVVPMRHCLVPTSWAVHMRTVMSPALVLGCAPFIYHLPTGTKLPAPSRSFPPLVAIPY